MGNRLSKSDSMTGTTSYVPDAANRLTSAGSNTYTNDADGNTLTGGGRTNTWDSQNRLTSCTTGGTVSAYTYGADGLRRSATVTPSGGPAVTTNNVYDGTMLAQEQRGSGILATYMNGVQGPECRIDETATSEAGTSPSGQNYQRGPTKWYVYDGLGSVVGEVDPSGNMTSSAKYDVYGAKRTGGWGRAVRGSWGHWVM